MHANGLLPSCSASSLRRSIPSSRARGAVPWRDASWHSSCVASNPAVLHGASCHALFGSMIQSVARQPELRGELQGIQWLGFALTEAVVFYGLLGSILAYVLV